MTKRQVKMICAGSRTAASYTQLRQRVLDRLKELGPDEELVIITGRASKGTDDMAYHLARWDLNLPYEEFFADWDNPELGKAAGMVRNHQMGDVANELTAFWDGTSRGTKDMIAYMKKLGKYVWMMILEPNTNLVGRSEILTAPDAPPVRRP